METWSDRFWKITARGADLFGFWGIPGIASVGSAVGGFLTWLASILPNAPVLTSVGWLAVFMCTTLAVILVLGAAGWARIQWLPKPKKFSDDRATVSFVRGASIFLDGGGHLKLAHLVGKFALTCDRLRIAVDVSSQGFVSTAAWAPARRYLLMEIRDPVRDQNVRVPLVLFRPVEGTDQTLWWGEPDEFRGNSVLTGMSRVRVAIIGPDQREQHIYFVLVRADAKDGRDAFFVLRERDFQFISEWEEKTRTAEISY